MEIRSTAEEVDNESCHQGRRSDESQPTENIVTLQEFSILLESKQPKQWRLGSRQIHRVPPQLRKRMQKSQYVYKPSMVSLGPYHHGKPKLGRVEELKYVFLDWFASSNKEKKCLFYNNILKGISEIRDCYPEVSIVSKYDDKALALMILLDACFIINYMEIVTEKKDKCEEFINLIGGFASVQSASNDIWVLENQIPFHVIKLLISSQYEKNEAEELLANFVNLIANPVRNHPRPNQIPRENEDPPIHILEACWRVKVEKPPNQQIDIQLAPRSRWLGFLTRREETARSVMDRIKTILIIYFTSRSVMDLKAKGIHFRPSSDYLMDIKFTSHASYGELQLPICHVSDNMNVIYSNMIAFEVSAATSKDLPVLSYANFMKSLIQGPADVKELQDKEILFNTFANLEQVVKVFKEINTFGLVGIDSFYDVKERVGKHCRSKSKTWIADLINTRLQSPWTIIALLAATMLLVLAFLQTYFTIHTVK